MLQLLPHRELDKQGQAEGRGYERGLRVRERKCLRMWQRKWPKLRSVTKGHAAGGNVDREGQVDAARKPEHVPDDGRHRKLASSVRRGGRAGQ